MERSSHFPFQKLRDLAGPGHPVAIPPSRHPYIPRTCHTDPPTRGRNAARSPRSYSIQPTSCLVGASVDQIPGHARVGGEETMVPAWKKKPAERWKCFFREFLSDFSGHLFRVFFIWECFTSIRSSRKIRGRSSRASGERTRR